jgi:perosamine synthetase
MLDSQLVSETVSFIRELYGTDRPIPLHEPRFHGREREYVDDAIASTFVSSVGAYVDRFEREFADYVGSAKAVAVVNGTSGLQVALQLVGVRPDDEVLTQALTFVATPNAIRYAGAWPVFLDVDMDTMGLSPTAVRDFLAQYAEKRGHEVFNRLTNRRISAIMPMHTFGFPADLDGLMAISTEWGIPIVEDAAEGLGSYFHGRHVGTIGKIGVFSFNGNKIITTGGGGMLVCNDLDLATKAKHLTTTAKQPHPYEFFHDQLGFNFRMPNINAALGCAQLESLDKFLLSKKELSAKYEQHFAEKGIKFRTSVTHTMANHWLHAIELSNRSERDQFLREMNAEGIGCRPIWQLMFRLPMYIDCLRDHQTNAVWLEDRIVNLPSSAIIR